MYVQLTAINQLSTNKLIPKMKIKNIKWTLMMALATVGVGLTSCEDEPDKYEIAGGKPSISYIRPASAESRDSLLTAASFSQNICIVGNNLRSIVKILFNDQSAVLNTSYMTDHTILLQVPDGIPSEVTDSIYFITSGNDTVSYPFKVTIPAPKITAMSNEHAKAGEEVTISGNYFLDYEDRPLKVTVGDSYELPDSVISSITQTSITFTVPEDMPEDFIHVISTFGDTKSTFKYMDTRGMLFDFDTPNPTTNTLLYVTSSTSGGHGWHSRTIASDDTSEGNYVVLGDADLAADAPWDDTNFSFEYWPGTWNYDFTGDGVKLNDVADFSNWESKALKFEMYIPSDNPWTSGPMQIIFSNTSAVTLFNANNEFFHKQGTLSRAIYMPWNNDNLSYDTGDKWVTVTIPFTDFAYDFDGNALSSTFTSTEDFAGLTIFVVKGSYNDKSVLPDGKDGHPIIRIDNIRVVPNE